MKFYINVFIPREAYSVQKKKIITVYCFIFSDVYVYFCTTARLRATRPETIRSENGAEYRSLHFKLEGINAPSHAWIID